MAASNRTAAVVKLLSTTSNRFRADGNVVPEDEYSQSTLTQPSRQMQRCFTDLRFGHWPGSENNYTEASVDGCMLRCVATDGCVAMSFHMKFGRCNLLRRRAYTRAVYENTYDASGEMVLAGKIADCEVEQKQRRSTRDNSKPRRGQRRQRRGRRRKPKQRLRRRRQRRGRRRKAKQRLRRKLQQRGGSTSIRECFTTPVVGRVYPGSSLGKSREASLDACMSRCAATQSCLAMTFEMRTGLCNRLNGTYQDIYAKSHKKVVANKLSGCNSCFHKVVTLFAERLGPSDNILDVFPDSSIHDCMSICGSVTSCYAMAKHQESCAALEASVDSCVSSS